MHINLFCQAFNHFKCQNMILNMVVDEAKNHGFRSQRNWGNLKCWHYYCCVKNMGIFPKNPQINTVFNTTSKVIPTQSTRGDEVSRTAK